MESRLDLDRLNAELLTLAMLEVEQAKRTDDPQLLEAAQEFLQDLRKLTNQ